MPGSQVVVHQVGTVEGTLVVDAAGCGPPGLCPDCGRRATRVHSRYWRSLTDMSVAGMETVVRLRVRRFFCDHSGCLRKTFAEQVCGLTERYRRTTPSLRSARRTVAVELGGRPAQRPCRKLLLHGGRTELSSLLTAPPTPQKAPRVLGIDEFTFRKGRTYGTLLVDIETSRPVDVLPDRDTETVAAWLHQHPGAQIVCRDRSMIFTKAVHQAAPQAQEVADRWHLLENLSSAVEKTCRQHRDCLRTHATRRLPLQPSKPPRVPKTPLLERVRQHHEDVQALAQAGWTLSAIGRRLGLDRKTVRRYRDNDLDTLLASARDRGAGVLTPYMPYIQTRFTAGCTVSLQLYREICDLGYTGSRHVVSRYVAQLRDDTAVPATAVIPAARAITSWIMRPRETLSQAETAALDKARLACCDIATACDFARAFTDLTRHRRGHLLMEWIKQAERDAPAPIRGFAGHLRQDLDAVTAGLTLPYSSGAVEGHVNRIKTIKRQMYGRASFSLLRARILIRP
ncbi:ISL3 family transposase [Streptomyces broussonetiae]|uniref:ISL3 family transposase n=1 Tax=Streptomyces broussonetiae TaxID=2686304 RepID=UPI0035DFA020